MRRKVQVVSIRVGSQFYRMIESQRQLLQKKMRFKKNIPTTEFTEMLARSGQLKIPKLNINLFKKNVKIKKIK